MRILGGREQEEQRGNKLIYRIPCAMIRESRKKRRRARLPAEVLGLADVGRQSGKELVQEGVTLFKVGLEAAAELVGVAGEGRGAGAAESAPRLGEHRDQHAQVLPVAPRTAIASSAGGGCRLVATAGGGIAASGGWLRPGVSGLCGID